MVSNRWVGGSVAGWSWEVVLMKPHVLVYSRACETFRFFTGLAPTRISPHGLLQELAYIRGFAYVSPKGYFPEFWLQIKTNILYNKLLLGRLML